MTDPKKKCPFCGEPDDGSGDNPTTYQCGTWMFSADDYARSPACLEAELTRLREGIAAARKLAERYEKSAYTPYMLDAPECAASAKAIRDALYLIEGPTK